MTGAEARKLVEAGTPCQWLDGSGNWNDCIITPMGGCGFLEQYKYRVNPNGGNLPVGTMGVTREMFEPGVTNRGGIVRCIKLPETISVMTPKGAIAESVILRAIDCANAFQMLILNAKKIETRADIRKRLLHL